MLRAIQGDLLANPSRGTVVPGLAGIRKARAENPARGKAKRGGFRYMYYFLGVRRRNLFAAPLRQRSAEGLNEKQKAALRAVVAELKGT